MLEVYTESSKIANATRKIKDIRELNIFKDTYREKTLYIKGKYSIPYTPNTIVDLSGFIVEEELDFSDCICEGEIDFSGTKFKKLNLKNAVFKAKITFHNCEFENVSFENTRFENLVDFYKSTFHNDVQFLQVDFMDRAIFSNVSFKGETQFKYNKVAKDTFISFESAKFEKSLDISRSNFHCNLHFWNIKIEGDENISQYTNYINDFSNEKVEPSVYAKIRETYRIIKNSFYKEDNRIEGLEFYKREMAVYEKELKEKSFWHKDRIMLLLNKKSNNYGTSWSRGLLFTVIVAFIFYIFILISLHNSLEWDICNLDAWDNFLKHFLEVINVTRWKDIEPFGVELNGFAYLSLFIGRIFIGYGYYQTIQAFRKYGKSS
ncbi:pentapeptide repeat-containing protein [Capnocytophaga felis]|uniref:Pentapeptide repeat-containing protein n=1 Tax=Capnocytophaga felis TaxID=2267611 RepID=A0A5M4B599_9FLAO|nr:pentapeptide repeat-containing protein [Capnocytophaga felis]GET44728.1 hypothetical protein RCZ01_00300 [Capnocytophaga felis]GET49696.1 hypothetical protein RCZ02_25270 [Capnocytophaga felis]